MSPALRVRPRRCFLGADDLTGPLVFLWCWERVRRKERDCASRNRTRQGSEVLGLESRRLTMMLVALLHRLRIQCILELGMKYGFRSPTYQPSPRYSPPPEPPRWTATRCCSRKEDGQGLRESSAYTPIPLLCTMFRRRSIKSRGAFQAPIRTTPKYITNPAPANKTESEVCTSFVNKYQRGYIRTSKHTHTHTHTSPAHRTKHQELPTHTVSHALGAGPDSHPVHPPSSHLYIRLPWSCLCRVIASNKQASIMSKYVGAPRCAVSHCVDAKCRRRWQCFVRG